MTGETPVRIGFTGVGSRGQSLLDRCLNMDDVAVPAVCDRQESHLQQAHDQVVESGREGPATYERYEELITRDDIDGIIIATPWEHHLSMAIEGMEAGKFIGLEVGPANSVEECWELVRTAERTGSHCMLLENCCYYRDVMAVLNMVRQGVFGELVHCRGGYGHDLREPIATGRGSTSGTDSDADRHYRRVHHEKRNGDLYPTHGVGPMAKCLGINHGNRFVSLTSTASKACGLEDWTETNLDSDHPSHGIDWSKGDVVTTVLRCANGETVVLTHDVSLPRPYTNMYHVQGTKGAWKRTNESIGGGDDPGLTVESAIHLEAESAGHTWESFEGYQQQYEHPIWETYRKQGVQAGHGGIDYLVLRDYVTSVKRDERPPIDVYDTATWTALTPLSEQSVAHGGKPVSVPDFTNGAWMSDDPMFGLHEDDLITHR